jgi:CheY-like chemotaxis protein
MKKRPRQYKYTDHSQLPVVLVIDDNPAIRDMVSWALELEGYEPAEAAEGQEALDWLQSAAREGRYPVVILLDLTMPGMDGATFLTRLHAQWEAAQAPQPRPAIVVITAAKGGHDVTSLGVEQIIVKPFHVRDLLDVVRVYTQ